MKKSDFKIRRKKHWAVGIALAALGVLINRFLAPECAEYDAIVQIVGITFAIAGLFIISLGTRDRKDEEEQS